MKLVSNLSIQKISQLTVFRKANFLDDFQNILN